MDPVYMFSQCPEIGSVYPGLRSARSCPAWARFKRKGITECGNGCESGVENAPQRFALRVLKSGRPPAPGCFHTHVAIL